MTTAWRLGAILVGAVIAIAGCATGPGPSPSPTPIPSPTAAEIYLLSGIRPDAAIDCVPVRSALPTGATAAVECAPNDGGVARFRVTQFSSTADVLALYIAEMTGHGVALNSGTCFDGQGESSYFPGPDDESIATRNGCFVADVAQFRAIDTGGTVYIAIVGKTAGVSRELDSYAWKDNQDTPGAPTLWRAP